MTVSTAGCRRERHTTPAWIKLCAAVALVTGFGWGGGTYSYAQTTQPTEAHPLMAERLSDLASETLRGQVLTTSLYRQAGALLEAASRLNPSEPRFHRLRYEALLQAGDIDGALAALVSYARLETTDLQAQAKIIELYTQRMETAEQKLKYLRQDLLGSPTIPSEIRSHAALLGARVLLERGERSAATKLANEATRLNALNAEAQRLNFELSVVNGTPLDRLAGLLAIVRASPLDYRAVSAVAEELSKHGIDQSWQWYEGALELAKRNGQAPDRGLLLDYTARLMSAGYTQPARQLVEAILQADPDDVGAHFIRLSLDRLSGDPLTVEANKQRARTSITNALIQLARVSGDVTATTMPSDTKTSFAAPSPVGIAQRVVDSKTTELKDAFVIAATDLAWLYLYYLEEDPDRITRSRDLVDALKLVLPPESSLLARLEGWLYLVQGKEAEARLKLSAVESDDGLAALGLLRLEKDPQIAGTRARGLRSNFSHGVVGAITSAEIAPKKPELVLSTVAEQMRQMLDGYPSQLLRLIYAPQEFYFLRAEPLTPAVEYGHPILVKVSLVNTSNLDLPLGPMGAIRNDLWFDAQIRGLRPASFPSTAFDRLSGPLVLHPRQAATRIVRVDQGRLQTYLRLTPFVPVPVTGSVITNPAVANESIAAGAGGYEVQFTRIVEQGNIPISTREAQQAMLAGLSSAPSDKRVGLIDAVVVNLQLLRKQSENPNPDTIATLRTAIDSLISDPDLTARSWGTFWTLLLADTTTKAAKADSGTKDAYWLVRMMTLAGMRSSDRALYRDIANRLSQDKDPVVAKFAQAVLDELDLAAESTQNAPSTQPSSAP